MAGKISQYPSSITTLESGDLFDVSEFLNPGYESKKLDWDDLLTNLNSQLTFQNFATNDLTLTGNRVHDLGVNDLTFGSTGDANLMKFETTNDRIGIGTATPTEKLEVVGNQYLNGRMGINIAPTASQELSLKAGGTGYRAIMRADNNQTAFRFYFDTTFGHQMTVDEGGVAKVILSGKTHSDFNGGSLRVTGAKSSTNLMMVTPNTNVEDGIRVENTANGNASVASLFTVVGANGINIRSYSATHSTLPSRNDVLANGGDLTLGTQGATDTIFENDGNVNAKIDNDSTSGNTRFLIYDVDNATLERVSVGAADSGGVGFKVLRIPN